MSVSIGDSYAPSTGHSYGPRRDTGRMPKPPNRTAWERVKEALIDAGYAGKQSDVERLIGVKQGSVSEWNRVGVTPGLDTAIALGLKLNVCAEWILTERGPKRPGPPMEPAALDLWNAWGQLSDEDRREVVGFVKAKIPVVPSRPLAPKAARPAR